MRLPDSRGRVLEDWAGLEGMRSSLDQLSIYAIDMITVVPLSMCGMYLFGVVCVCARLSLRALPSFRSGEGSIGCVELPQGRAKKSGKRGGEGRGRHAPPAPGPARSTHRSTFSTHSGIMVSMQRARDAHAAACAVGCSCGCGGRQQEKGAG